MKMFRISIFLLMIGILSFFPSCEEEDFLTEKPKSFNAPENTFINTKGFETALNGCYNLFIKEYHDFVYGTNWAGTDLALNALTHGVYLTFEVLGDALTSEDYASQMFWDWSYRMIANANQIINNVDNEDVVWDSPDDKSRIEAEARFFRAYAYRTLTYTFGGVPIVEEVAKPFRLDYTRASLSECLEYMIDDFSFAEENLPETVEVDGKLVKAAAQHYLAETYIYNDQPELAEPILESIIGSGTYQLMTERFGNHTTDPGDVFSDLFKENNYNRKSGNLESILVVQQQYGYEGGIWAFYDWSRRAWVPYYANVNGFLLADSLGGRGVGRLRPTQFWLDSYEAQDMRNSRYNIRRHWYINDPSNDDYGKEMEITEELRTGGLLYETTRKFDFGKTADDPGYPFNHKDNYKIRLANTYLLLAEAEFLQDKLGEAADHINEVRNRANATEISAGDVTIDFIMDERARELFGEYPRKYALTRTGTFVSRVQAHNPITGEVVQEYNTYWPIPQTAIDANSGAELVQNEGYEQ